MAETEFDDLSIQELIELSEKTTDGFRFNRSSIYKKAIQKCQQTGDDMIAANMRFEALAFDLIGSNDKPVRFGFMMRGTYESKEGEWEYPDRDNDFPDDAFAYYRQCVDSTSNPILKARYSDILWDFKNDFLKSQNAIEAYCACSDIYLKNEWFTELCDSLSRALKIAIQTNQQELIKNCYTKHIDMLDHLALDRNYRWVQEVAESLCKEMRGKLENLVDLTHIRSRCEEGIGYLRETDNMSFNIQRSLLRTIELSWKIESNECESKKAKYRTAESYIEEASVFPRGHLISASILEKALKLIIELGDRSQIEDDLKIRIENEYRLAEEHEMGVIESKIEIPSAIFDDWYDSLYKGRSICEICNIIASDNNLLPSYDRSYKQAVEDAKEFVFRNIVTRKVISTGIITQLDESNEKLEYDAIVLFRMRYAFGSNTMLERLFDTMATLSLDYHLDIAECINLMPFILPWRRTLISAGLEAFGRGDYISCINILIFQIEGCLRDFLGYIGLPITSAKCNQTFQSRMLSDIISTLSSIKGFDIDLVHLINISLVHQYGDNLRNNIAHGLSDPSFFNKQNAILIIYILLKLSIYRAEKKEITNEMI